jgi:hypothetical protein
MDSAEKKLLASSIKASATGFDRATAVNIFEKMITASQTDDALVCVACVSNIRRNVSQAVIGTRKLLADYPELKITGRQGTQDEMNLGAMRLIGYIVAKCSSHSFAKALINKGGDPYDGYRGTATNKTAALNLEYVKEQGFFRLEITQAWKDFSDAVFAEVEAALE